MEKSPLNSEIPPRINWLSHICSTPTNPKASKNQINMELKISRLPFGIPPRPIFTLQYLKLGSLLLEMKNGD